MNLNRVATALLLAAAPTLCVACDSNAKICNEFFDVALPILSAVSSPASATSSAGTIDWARDTGKQYERLALETENLSERTREGSMKNALLDEKEAAAAVAKQLDELVKAATSLEPSKIATVTSALEKAARSEREAANTLARQCSR